MFLFKYVLGLSFVLFNCRWFNDTQMLFFQINKIKKYFYFKEFFLMIREVLPRSLLVCRVKVLILMEIKKKSYKLFTSKSLKCSFKSPTTYLSGTEKPAQSGKKPFERTVRFTRSEQTRTVFGEYFCNILSNSTILRPVSIMSSTISTFLPFRLFKSSPPNI